MAGVSLPTALGPVLAPALGVGQTVYDGNLLAAAALAVLGGLVSFASPCVLPLVPGFVGYMTGLTPADREARARRRAVVAALLFCVGFSAVFLSVAVLFTSLGAAMVGHRDLLLRLGGVVVLAMGLLFLGAGGGREWRVRWRPAAGLGGAPLLGAAFGLGMSACSGPVLGAIIALSTSLGGDSGKVSRGAVLAVAYSIGMAVPFVLLAAGWASAATTARWLRDHHRAFQLAGGGLLVLVGALMLLGVWEPVVTWIQTALSDKVGTVL